MKDPIPNRNASLVKGDVCAFGKALTRSCSYLFEATVHTSDTWLWFVHPVPLSVTHETQLLETSVQVSWAFQSKILEFFILIPSSCWVKLIFRGLVPLISAYAPPTTVATIVASYVMVQYSSRLVVLVIRRGRQLKPKNLPP